MNFKDKFYTENSKLFKSEKARLIVREDIARFCQGNKRRF